MSAHPGHTQPDVGVEVEVAVDDQTQTIHVPHYHVILLDDDDHSYEYVIEMLVRLFGHSVEKAFQMAVDVDRAGRVVVDTTTQERAGLKRDQILAFGADWRIPHSRSGMSATIEPAE